MLQEYDHVWACDFEFTPISGELPIPICLVAREWRSGQEVRQWLGDGRVTKSAPFGVGSKTLMVAFFATAELSCFSALGWQFPSRLLDLGIEFRNLSNGMQLPHGRGLLGALKFFGLGGADAQEKAAMQQRAIKGGPWMESEKRAMLDYCASDVEALIQLLPLMVPLIDNPRAIRVRGEYIKAVASVEAAGIPMDTANLIRIRDNWGTLKHSLIKEVDKEFRVYDGTTFKEELFRGYLKANNIPWPTHDTGHLKLDRDTFRELARIYPSLRALKELRASIAELRLNELPVGRDGRTRTPLWACSTITGRNAPSTSAYPFGAAKWVRFLIKPAPGAGLAYIDWSAQEHGIAAALSGDEMMLKDYISGDPYLACAIRLGAAPPHATKVSHSEVRNIFKQVVLATNYGMGPDTLALKIKQTPRHAQALLQAHRETYRAYWEWSDANLNYAALNLEIHTSYGWKLNIIPTTKTRTVMNFPMQGNGSEMLKLATIYATRKGIKLCGLIHDAILLESDQEGLANDVEVAKAAMAQASRDVLQGFELRTDVKLVRFPECFHEEKGEKMWRTIQRTLHSIGGDPPKYPAERAPS